MIIFLFLKIYYECKKTFKIVLNDSNDLEKIHMCFKHIF